MTGEPPRYPKGLFIALGLALTAVLAAGGWNAWQQTRPISLSVRLYNRPAGPGGTPVQIWPAPAFTPAATPSPAPSAATPKATAHPSAQWIGQSAEHLTPPKLPLHRGMTGWETQIDSLLSENAPDRTKAERLLQRLPFLPEEAYARATREAVDRLPDADYPRLVRPLIIHPGTHGAIASVLFADLLERPDEITVPTLVEIAEQPEHPFAESAIDDLDLIVDKAKSGWNERIARMRAAMKYKPKPE